MATVKEVVPVATVSFLVGLAMGSMTVISVYSARLAVIEASTPKIEAIYGAMLQNGMIKPKLGIP